MRKLGFLLPLMLLITCNPFELDNPEALLNSYEKALIGTVDYWSFDRGDSSDSGSGNSLSSKGDFFYENGGPKGGMVTIGGDLVNYGWAETSKPVFDFPGGKPYEFTVAFWIKVDSVPGQQWVVLSDSAKGICSLQIELRTDLVLYVYLNNSNSWTSFDNLELDVWYYVAVTLDRLGTASLYVTALGNLVTYAPAQTGIAAFPSAGRPFTIGCRLDDLTGLPTSELQNTSAHISNLIFIDRCLSYSELQTIMDH